MWKNHFSQLLNIHGVSDVRQAEIHTAEPLVPEPSAFQVEMTVENTKRYISGTDQIPAEVIKIVDRTICFEIRKRSNCIWNKEELPEVWKESIGMVIKQTVVIREE
jgi:hypothetical protein